MLQLFTLFVVVPLVELALLLKLADLMGWKETLLLVIVTGVAGTWLARAQGLRTLRAVQESLSAGKIPTDSLLDGALILVAGALLLTPGVLTDALGLLLLVPVTRSYFRRGLVRWFKARVQIAPFPEAQHNWPDVDTVDSYVVNDRSDR